MKGLNIKIAALLTVCLAGFSACNAASGPDGAVITPDEEKPACLDTTSAGCVVDPDEDKDTTGPKVVDAQAFTISGRGSFYSITFDEAINVETATVAVREGLNDGAEVPTKLVAGTDGKSVAVSGDFQEGMIYFASVDVTDLAGNANDPVSLKFQLPITDEDADGVADSADKCPDTMKDWPVDANGCAIFFTLTPAYNFNGIFLINGSTN